MTRRGTVGSLPVLYVQAPEPLGVERARLCVDTLRDHFSTRVTGLSGLRDEWEQRLNAERNTAQRWAANMADSLSVSFYFYSNQSVGRKTEAHYKC